MDSGKGDANKFFNASKAGSLAGSSWIKYAGNLWVLAPSPVEGLFYFCSHAL
jgi:hypothetical protein